MDIEIWIKFMELFVIISMLTFSGILLVAYLIRLRTWCVNRRWREGMKRKLVAIRKEHDQYSEFALAIEEGIAGRGILKEPMKGVVMADPDFGEFLLDFHKDVLIEIEEEERELERAIREL